MGTGQHRTFWTTTINIIAIKCFDIDHSSLDSVACQEADESQGLIDLLMSIFIVIVEDWWRSTIIMKRIVLSLKDHCLLILNQIIYFTFLTNLHKVRLIYMVFIKNVNYYGSKLVCNGNVRSSFPACNPFDVKFDCK